MDQASRALLDLFRSLDDASQFAALPHLSRYDLLKIWEAFGPEECDCPLVPLPCGCDGPCDCGPDYAPCPHFKPWYFSWAVQVRICELLFPEPHPPAVPSLVMLSEAMAFVMARRARAGDGLRHHLDAIRRGADERIARNVERLRNGAARARQLKLEEAGQ